MSIIVQFNKSWSYDIEFGNVTRHIPPNWRGEMPDDVAAAAIFEGAAEAVGEITPDVQHFLDQFSRIKSDMTDEEIAEILQSPPPSADPPSVDGDGDAADPNTGELFDKPAKKSRKAAT